LFEAPNIIKVPGRKKPFINRFRAAGKKIWQNQENQRKYV
jgi:hypothetical protein